VQYRKSSRKSGDSTRLIKSISCVLLLEELDGPPDADVERAWLDEAQCRSHELDTGAVQAIPAEDVFAKARAELKRR
jgi:hypothetical protein